MPDMTEEFDLSDTPAVPKKTERKGSTRLDLLREKLEKKIERPDRLIEIPERPGVGILVSPNITQEQLRTWRKQAGEGTKQDFNITKFSCYVLAHTNVGFFLEGEEIFDDDGNPMTFASPFIQEFLEVTRPVPEGVRALFGIDPHLEAAAVAVLEAAGYGEEVESTDPFKTS